MVRVDASSPLTALIEPFLFLSGVGIAVVLFLFGQAALGQILLEILLGIGIVLSAWQLIRELRDHHVGVDVVALSAMLAAGVFHQWATGIVILLMLSGGEALEQYASRRARRHLTRLIAGVPTIAHRRAGTTNARTRLIDVPVETIKIGDVFIVKPGEMIPVDGVIVSGTTTVDESMLTGESITVDKTTHDRVMGGSLNQSGLLEVRAIRISAASQYQRIVTLVREAERVRAPFVRLADRYSLLFTLVTAAVASMAWFLSGDASRVLAVLVVATPCPLILATPIAILSGMSRSAKRGMIIRNGGALETLARVRAMVFDKTGTLTYGAPAIKRIIGFHASERDILYVAASLDQASSHALARALVAYASAHEVTLTFPGHFKESIGKGVQGVLGGKTFSLGRATYLHERGLAIPSEVIADAHRRKRFGERTVYVADRHRAIGVIVFSDKIRPGLKPFFRALSHLGVRSVSILTGDKKAIAERLARAVGIRSVVGECLPEDKEREIEKLQKRFVVAMVGDGVNDAPALARADVGIAMGASGSGMASETADMVITVDDVTRVRDALRIAQETMSTAKRGIIIGIGLSIVLMLIAAHGFLPPIYGAFLQEGVDVIVILHALRLTRVGRDDHDVV